MLTSQAVSRDLPRLRRYARALTGNQTSGDAYVGATLEALAEDPSALAGPDGTSVALFRAFTKIWNSLDVNGSVEVELPADRHLVRLTPLPRQAFDPTATEIYTEADAAKILDVRPLEIRQLIEDRAASLPPRSPPTCSSSRTNR